MRRFDGGALGWIEEIPRRKPPLVLLLRLAGQRLWAGSYRKSRHYRNHVSFPGTGDWRLRLDRLGEDGLEVDRTYLVRN